MTVLISTSRNASIESRQFARDLTHRIPHANYFPRGAKDLDFLLKRARFDGFERLILVLEQNKQPAELQFIAISTSGFEFAEKFYLRVEKFIRDFKAKKIKQPAELKFPKHPFTSLLELKSNSKSNVELKIKANQFAFFAEKTEMGPRFALKALK